MYLSCRGAELFYTDEGEGPLVLLLHGFACDSHDWSWQIPVLAAAHRVVAMDARGHGRSSSPPSGYAPRELAADAAELLTAVAPGAAAVVVGHSAGGVTASILAVERPDLVRGLVLVDPAYVTGDDVAGLVVAAMSGPNVASTAADLFGVGLHTPDTPPYILMWHRRRVLGMKDWVLEASVAASLSGPDAWGTARVSRPRLAGRTCPRIVLCATEDAAQFERELPMGEHDEVHVIDAGHWLHQQAAAQTNALLVPWLAGLP